MVWCLIETNSSPEFELISFPRKRKRKKSRQDGLAENRFRKLPSKIFPPIQSGVLSLAESLKGMLVDFTVMNMTVKLLVVCCVFEWRMIFIHTHRSVFSNEFIFQLPSEKRIPILLNDVISCWRVPLKLSNSFGSFKTPRVQKGGCMQKEFFGQ